SGGNYLERQRQTKIGKAEKTTLFSLSVMRDRGYVDPAPRCCPRRGHNCRQMRKRSAIGVDLQRACSPRRGRNWRGRLLCRLRGKMNGKNGYRQTKRYPPATSARVKFPQNAARSSPRRSASTAHVRRELS